jgi:hypothetical protein
MAKPIKDLTGQTFGKLVVIGQGEDYVSDKNRRYKTWKCKCDCGNIIDVMQAQLTKNQARSCGHDKVDDVRHMSTKEKEDRDTLCKYVEKIMGYDENQKLSKFMVLRLDGLRTGKHVENKKEDDMSNYPYDIILLTFKFCMPDIQRGLASNSFHDEMHKFNYILKIVESNLNNVYMRIKNSKNAEEKTKTANVEAVTYQGASYQRKTDDNISDRLKDLW